jgi:hypothetical protein
MTTEEEMTLSECNYPDWMQRVDAGEKKKTQKRLS